MDLDWQSKWKKSQLVAVFCKYRVDLLDFFCRISKIGNVVFGYHWVPRKWMAPHPHVLTHLTFNTWPACLWVCRVLNSCAYLRYGCIDIIARQSCPGLAWGRHHPGRRPAALCAADPSTRGGVQRTNQLDRFGERIFGVCLGYIRGTGAI